MATDSLGSASASQAAETAPSGLRLLRGLLRFQRNPIEFVSAMAARPEDVVHYKLWRRHVYLLKHPEHVKLVLVTRQHEFMKGAGLQWAKRFLGEGLLTSEGEFHTRQRRLAQPALHRQHVGGYAKDMVELAGRACTRFADGAPLQMEREMAALTLAVAGRTLFEVDTEGDAAEVGAALTAIVRLFPRFALPFAGILDVLPLPSTIRYHRARRRLDRMVYRLIEERRRQPAGRRDLLSMLLEARDEDGSGMSDRQLRDEVMTLLLAGHETTANALTWTWYLLSQNPAAEAAFHAEVDAVLGGRAPSLEDLPRLAYTERVLTESMRLFPPAWGLGRRVMVEQDVDGVRIPVGALILVCQFVTHRDARWFPDPLRFDPDRWMPEARAARPRFSYFPFGGGARNCIGEPFAWMEGVLLLAAIGQRWRFRLAPGQRVEPQSLITLRPRYGMRMIAERRAAGGEHPRPLRS